MDYKVRVLKRKVDYVTSIGHVVFKESESYYYTADLIGLDSGMAVIKVDNKLKTVSMNLIRFIEEV